MRSVTIIIAGFGNVGKAFARLIARKQEQIKQESDLELKLTGFSTGSHGCFGKQNGFDLTMLEPDQTTIPAAFFQESTAYQDTSAMIAQCHADIFIENSPVNYETGEPAASYLAQALQKGMHAVTANKGPIVHAYAKLNDLAAKQGKKFLFESTVMDGAPVFSVVREALPAMKLCGFEGIFNSCTNLILCRMENGESFDEAVRYAQSIGIAETDPSGDIDGWDAAVKVAALSTVLLDNPVTPQQVDRKGIREIHDEDMLAAKNAGKRWKLLCKAEIRDGNWQLSVAPHMIAPSSPFYSVDGTSSYILFRSDVLPGLGLLESNPSPDTTAYGMLADILNIYRHDKQA